MRAMLIPLCSAGVMLLSADALLADTPNQLSAQEKSAGWLLLFDGRTPQGWHSFKQSTFPASGWVVEDGWFHCLGKNGGDILSDGEYDQFQLEWEWKLEQGGNSGLKYFVLETRKSAVG